MKRELAPNRTRPLVGRGAVQATSVVSFAKRRFPSGCQAIKYRFATSLLLLSLLLPFIQQQVCVPNFIDDKMMKVSAFYLAIVAVSLSLTVAWGFALPSPRTSRAATTQLEMSYYRGYDDYSLGSSFLLENQMNDAYSSQRMFDRNRDDIHYSPYSMSTPRYAYGDYYGGGMYGGGMGGMYGGGYGMGYRRPYYNR